jgi:transcriptional accessory protein Tex/SPT6
MEKDYEDWVSECDRLSRELQEKAKSHKTMDELEDLLGEYKQKIGELMMQGVTDDKGTGSDQKPSSSKNNLIPPNFCGKKASIIYLSL